MSRGAMFFGDWSGRAVVSQDP